jgi:hypothetical protein
MSKISIAARIAWVLSCATLSACAGRNTDFGSSETASAAAIRVDLEENRCVVEPYRAVIDYERSQGAPLSVAWRVQKGALDVAWIVPHPQESMPNLFDVLPTIGRFESSDDSERPIHEPIWKDGEYVYRYLVTLGEHKCAGEICIRHEGQGCTGAPTPS